MIEHYKFRFNNTIVTVKHDQQDCSKYRVETEDESWSVTGPELKQKYEPVNSSAKQLLRSIV